MDPGSPSSQSPTRPTTSKSTGDLTADEGSAASAATWTENDELRLAKLKAELHAVQKDWSEQQEDYHDEV